MHIFGRRSFLRGGMYHLALILVTAFAFNGGFLKLTGINLANRLLSGVTIPDAVIVLWNNWVD